ncbi:uncharacterized protein PITG_21492 [Phytophthora infestans T30-4]|uniref:Uncharacterized protein n=1 Tax=Phytophthora infestans (strain T30-4) TaxID=403677 RepID=D0P4C1_PHYIT|nr:uncharacterized protein PITG_21492 [Phytophthora infestans T30-4]EEY64745.1 conserved hypothetical protein [Phytophthora infestans T30-4]|eukprot:XP_002894852.1 conserved hypothetical protein [Phytophthora infestans T30-4]
MATRQHLRIYRSLEQDKEHYVGFSLCSDKTPKNRRIAFKPQLLHLRGGDKVQLSSSSLGHPHGTVHGWWVGRTKLRVYEGNKLDKTTKGQGLYGSYSLPEMYNMDETAIQFDMPPARTWTIKGRKGSAKIQNLTKHCGRMTAVLTVRADEEGMRVVAEQACATMVPLPAKATSFVDKRKGGDTVAATNRYKQLQPLSLLLEFYVENKALTSWKGFSSLITPPRF